MGHSPTFYSVQFLGSFFRGNGSKFYVPPKIREERGSTPSPRSLVAGHERLRMSSALCPSSSTLIKRPMRASWRYARLTAGRSLLWYMTSWSTVATRSRWMTRRRSCYARSTTWRTTLTSSLDRRTPTACRPACKANKQPCK